MMAALTRSDRASIATAEPVLTQEQVDAFPTKYTMKELIGDCMEPFVSDGAKLVFSATERLEAGDVGVIFWAPGRNAPGSFQAQVKQIMLPRTKDGSFVYRMFQPYTVREGRRENVLAIHKCIGMKKSDGSVRYIDWASIIAPFQFVRASRNG